MEGPITGIVYLDKNNKIMAAEKKYQRIYLTTFALIAVLITASIIIIDYIAAEEARMVEVNDIGGRQRMLSERTVHLLLEYAMENNQETRDQIVKLMELSLQKFDQAHQQLIRGRLSDGEVVIFSEVVENILFHYLPSLSVSDTLQHKLGTKKIVKE